MADLQPETSETLPKLSNAPRWITWVLGIMVVPHYVYRCALGSTPLWCSTVGMAFSDESQGSSRWGWLLGWPMLILVGGLFVFAAVTVCRELPTEVLFPAQAFLVAWAIALLPFWLGCLSIIGMILMIPLALTMIAKLEGAPKARFTVESVHAGLLLVFTLLATLAGFEYLTLIMWVT